MGFGFATVQKRVYSTRKCKAEWLSMLFYYPTRDMLSYPETMAFAATSAFVLAVS